MKPALVYQVAIGAIPPRVQACFNQNQAICKDANIPYVLDKLRPSFSPVSLHSNILRLTVGATFDNCIYLDWDCVLQGVPDLDPSKALFPIDRCGRLDYYAFWSGETYPLFAEIAQATTLDAQHGVSSLQKVRSKIGIFPDNLIIHYGFGLGRDPWMVPK